RTNTVSVFLNLGNGQFSDEQRFAIAASELAGATPFSIAAGDFNRDGFLDLATSNANTNNVSILLGDGTGRFTLPGRSGSANHSKAPLLVDLNGDGVRDSVAIDAQGRVLLRLGRPGQPGVFAPAVVVNAAQIAAEVSAADFTLVNDGAQHLLAILNRSTGQNSQNSVLTLYRFNGAGKPNLVSTVALGGHFDQIAAAKLDGNNRDDLVALDAAAGTLTTFLRSGSGFVANGAPIQVGSAPSVLLAANLGGSIDSLLVADAEAGSVSVLAGNGSSPVSYRGSSHAVELTADPTTNAAILATFDDPTALAVGNLNDLDDSIPDLIEVQTGTNTVSVLLAKSGGGFVDPQSSQEIQTGSQPIAVAAGKFDADNHVDLAVLEADGQVEIFLGDGHGNFQFSGAYDVGNSPVGLSIYKVNGDNKNDLMISNRAGDVVTLLGNGDGTFRSFTRAGKSMGLAVGDGSVVVTNQSKDRVIAPGSQQVSQRDDGVNAPTAVRLTDNLGNPIDLNGDALPDMVVANSGGNNILIYLGISGGGFDLANPILFSTGTDPVDVEVADINGDAKQDVIVTNYGSNDVSILLGTGDDSVDAAT
ncbi:MAG TPA: VCBS repeat-containing protein, partial [Pirellulales bacterium]